MPSPSVLIIDDEPDILELLEITLNRMNIQTVCAHNVQSAKQALSQYAFDLCLTDMKLPDGNGLELVDYIQNTPMPFPVAVITAHGNMDTAINAMKKGAFDFLSKPVDLNVLRQLVTDALKLSPTLSTSSENTSPQELLLGESEVMCHVRETIAKVARSQAPVYINGESGSGKELVARLIHQQGPRYQEPFIAVNCGAIPHDLMESEFFGHIKGSFTGAINNKTGLFQAANKGTLFLDEVADLPLGLQVKLLRALQEKKIRPVGSHKEISINVRLLSATNKNLTKMVEDGQFRQDLFYRINVIDLKLPPLRERIEDIPLLANHLLKKLSLHNDQPCPSINSQALNTLKNYNFPGNVRELENILERALALYDGQSIGPDDLKLSDMALTTPFAFETDLADTDFSSLEDYLETIERKAITQALEDNRWNKTATAKQLGLTFRSLRYRLKKLGLE